MVLAITAALAGDLTPQAVQVVVSGMTVGQAYTVTCSWSGGVLPVRGGTGVAASAQLVLGHVAAPINTPLAYTVDHAGATATSAAVTIPADGRLVLSTVDGSVSVSIPAAGFRDNAAPRRRTPQFAAFEVEGRADPVIRYTLTASATSSVVVVTAGVLSSALDALLSLGGSLLLRTDGGVRDLPAVVTCLVTGIDSVLTGLVDADGSHRRWTLAYQEIGDPEPSTVVPIATWDDVDAYYAASTWTAFDSQWSAATWNDLDAFDWA